MKSTVADGIYANPLSAKVLHCPSRLSGQHHLTSGGKPRDSVASTVQAIILEKYPVEWSFDQFGQCIENLKRSSFGIWLTSCDRWGSLDQMCWGDLARPTAQLQKAVLLHHVTYFMCQRQIQQSTRCSCWTCLLKKWCFLILLPWVKLKSASGPCKKRTSLEFFASAGAQRTFSYDVPTEVAGRATDPGTLKGGSSLGCSW